MISKSDSKEETYIKKQSLIMFGLCFLIFEQVQWGEGETPEVSFIGALL